MRTATLTRLETGDSGTFGRLVTDRGFQCVTGELPWRENASNKSSIPKGVYLCTWRMSSRHGMCYHLENVPGRSGVLIHSANFCGDVSLGQKNQLLGCIAPGLSIRELEGQKAVIASRLALAALEAEFAHEPFTLTIV